jgi:hypothetical protein
MSRTLFAIALLIVTFCGRIHAQQEEVSLGEIARAARRAKPVDTNFSAQAPEADDSKVIDNDNLAIVMDKAESARLNGKPVFAVDPIAKAFRMVSPDGSCSLSFDARTAATAGSAYIASDLPQDELLKLEGPATIHDDVLEVSVHNGTAWELKEIVVGVTVLQSQPSRPEIQPARLVSPVDSGSAEKLPDLTVLYHLKGSSVPNSTSTFQGTLGGNFGDSLANNSGNNFGNSFGNNKDWHWSIVAARGIPPASQAVPADAVSSAPGPNPGIAPLPPGSSAAVSQTPTHP